jgi:NADH-quinone oxidoreductase subunit H
MGLSLVSVFILAGSMSTSGIVTSQTQVWWFLPLLPAFLIYLVSMVGETNRLPFDLPEAEGELVSGYMTEYSSMKFAWFFLAEYINMLNVSAVATTLFLGGWRAPWPISAINDGMFNHGWWPVLWFLAKLWFFMFVFVWIRGSVLRFRYDQFMKIGWKVLIPAALVWVVCVGAVQGVRQFSGLDLRSVLFVLAGIVVVGLVVSFLIPEKKTPPGPTRPPGPQVYDPYAGGYPVPPLPGQVLPPSPRKQRAAANAAAAADAEKQTTPQEVHGG